MQDLSILIIPYEIYHVHVHLNFIIYMFRYNMVVDVNEMGVKHTCRFLLGQRWRSKLCWRRSLSICCVKMDRAKCHGGMLAFGGPKFLQEPNLCLQFCWNLSFFLFLMLQWTASDTRWKKMYVICWFNAMLNGNVIHVMLLFLCWDFCFDKWVEKWDELVGQIFIWVVYSVDFG